jgi:hypothetical protein
MYQERELKSFKFSKTLELWWLISRLYTRVTTKGRGKEFNWHISLTDLENQRLECQCTGTFPYFEVLAKNGMLG